MVDIANLVPSTRDFLQAIATRRKKLALVPLVESTEDVARLVEVGVTAFAVAEPGDLSKRLDRAIGSTPLVVLRAVASTDDALAARESGADAVVVDAAADYESLSKAARSTRMAALALARDVATATRITSTSAKAILLSVHGIEPIAPILKPLPPTMRVLAHVPSADEAALRAMRGVVDAAIVESAMYLSTSFETLREELDP
jgi:hypothetical protein